MRPGNLLECRPYARQWRESQNQDVLVGRALIMALVALGMFALVCWWGFSRADATAWWAQ